MKVWPILLAADTGLHMSWGGFEGWLCALAVALRYQGCQICPYLGMVLLWNLVSWIKMVLVLWDA